MSSEWSCESCVVDRESRARPGTATTHYSPLATHPSPTTMYRRRRRLARAEVAFGFDSFLDLVANVIGIILRLILVAWVGGRSYHALMQWRELPPEPAPAAQAAPQRDDDPLAGQIARMQQELAEARARLLAQM